MGDLCCPNTLYIRVVIVRQIPRKLKAHHLKESGGSGSHDAGYLLLKLAFPNQFPNQSCQISEIEEKFRSVSLGGLSDRPFPCPLDGDDAWYKEF